VSLSGGRENRFPAVRKDQERREARFPGIRGRLERRVFNMTGL
jgi:hypothetical protein